MGVVLIGTLMATASRALSHLRGAGSRSSSTCEQPIPLKRFVSKLIVFLRCRVELLVICACSGMLMATSLRGSCRMTTMTSGASSCCELSP
eukprot:scaffold49409_cov17-Prasinocladus_malaysianus.AAC.1